MKLKPKTTGLNGNSADKATTVGAGGERGWENSGDLGTVQG